MERLLDVSELEAPEPLVQGIAALERLAEGDYLRFCHRMRPCHLYRYLQDNGFAADTRRGRRCVCEVFIWRADDTAAGSEAAEAAEALTPWPEGEE